MYVLYGEKLECSAPSTIPTLFKMLSSGKPIHGTFLVFLPICHEYWISFSTRMDQRHVENTWGRGSCYMGGQSCYLLIWITIFNEFYGRLMVAWERYLRPLCSSVGIWQYLRLRKSWQTLCAVKLPSYTLEKKVCSMIVLMSYARRLLMQPNTFIGFYLQWLD